MENKQQSNSEMKDNKAVKKKMVSEFPKSSVNIFVCYLGTGGKKIAIWNLYEYLHTQCPKHRNAVVSFLPLVPGLLTGLL